MPGLLGDERILGAARGLYRLRVLLFHFVQFPGDRILFSGRPASSGHRQPRDDRRLEFAVGACEPIANAVGKAQAFDRRVSLVRLRGSGRLRLGGLRRRRLRERCLRNGLRVRLDGHATGRGIGHADDRIGDDRGGRIDPGHLDFADGRDVVLEKLRLHERRARG